MNRGLDLEVSDLRRFKGPSDTKKIEILLTYLSAAYPDSDLTAKPGSSKHQYATMLFPDREKAPTA